LLHIFLFAPCPPAVGGAFYSEFNPINKNVIPLVQAPFVIQLAFEILLFFALLPLPLKHPAQQELTSIAVI
jgi:hypothetical protein